MVFGQLPFDKAGMEKIISKFPTPFHVYDEKAIIQNARELNKAFSILPGGFREYFAVKALPNPFILKILKKEGFGADCSALPELLLSEKAGITGESIMFSSNDTPANEFVKARELGAIINLDDITHISFLEKSAGIPELICFRYNPGSTRTGGNAIIGKPEEAKYGLTKQQLFDAYKIMKDKGVKRFGLHTMVISNELNPDYFIETAQMLFDLVVELSAKLGIRFEFVNLGGGIGTPYRLEQKPVDYNYVAAGVKKAYEQKISANNLHPLKVLLECGRVITGPYGYLVTRAIHEKHTYREYIGVDACMANLMRPAMYGAYHHISVLGKENAPLDQTYDEEGSLCENTANFDVSSK